MTGVIFSDLGVASSFMALDWVQDALKQSLGFVPFPATLNVRPKGADDAEIWRRKRTESPGVPFKSAHDTFCSARLYPIEITGALPSEKKKVTAAILVPEVADYPSDKIEIVAPMRLKDYFRVDDGDAITLEFVN